VADQQSGAASLPAGYEEQVFTTSEGPVVITTHGKLVFVAESFPLELARKLTALVLDAQGSGDMKMAMGGASGELPGDSGRLTGDLIRFISSCGVMKAAVDGAVQAGR
jgi:hypothetical protein